MGVPKKPSELLQITTPLDADVTVIDDGTNPVWKLTWANIKATLKAYFDTLYQLWTADANGITYSGNIGVGVASDPSIKALFRGRVRTGNATDYIDYNPTTGLFRQTAGGPLPKFEIFMTGLDSQDGLVIGRDAAARAYIRMNNGVYSTDYAQIHWISAGVLEINNGTVGTLRDLIVRNLGLTASRVTKVWAADIESTNEPSINGTGLSAAVLTLTNKRVTKRVTTIVSSATPTVNSDNCDAVTITALVVAITSMTSGLSGTPTNFQPLIYRFYSAAAQTISWGAMFISGVATLPPTTLAGKVVTVGLFYDTVAAVWVCDAAGSRP